MRMWRSSFETWGKRTDVGNAEPSAMKRKITTHPVTMVDIQKFLNFIKAVLNPIQAGVFWNHIGWGQIVPPLFLFCLWSNYNQTWHDGTLGQNLSKAIKSLLTFQVKIRVPLSFVQLS